MTQPPSPDQTMMPTSVCPRHPDREAYVRCQRCGRPACPECQRPAAVGIQCVDCVRESARSAPTAATVFGGRTGGDPALVTKVIIGICVVVFVAQLARPALTQDLSFAPVVGWSEPWRFLTSAFLHSPGNLLHIGFNMLVLWQIGPYLESLVGRARFVALYLVSAFGGSVGYLLLAAAPTSASTQVFFADNPSWATGVVGASGAVFGLFGVLLLLNRHLGRSTAGIGFTIIANGVLGFVVPGIAWQAHLGGFLTGAACAGLFTLLKSPSRRRLQWPALAGVVVVLAALAVVKYSTVPVFFR
ncbi:MAG: rhomboid family intramembrane serine protease [Actinomycetota bacterium]|nr:rhomboid family intramembrane serine protease [Actinomycetota bacterium]